jgi:hypothetical protein
MGSTCCWCSSEYCPYCWCPSTYCLCCWCSSVYCPRYWCPSAYCLYYYLAKLDEPQKICKALYYNPRLGELDFSSEDAETTFIDNAIPLRYGMRGFFRIQLDSDRKDSAGLRLANEYSANRSDNSSKDQCAKPWYNFGCTQRS